MEPGDVEAMICEYVNPIGEDVEALKKKVEELEKKFAELSGELNKVRETANAAHARDIVYG